MIESHPARTQPLFEDLLWVEASLLRKKYLGPLPIGMPTHFSLFTKGSDWLTNAWSVWRLFLCSFYPQHASQSWTEGAEGSSLCRIGIIGLGILSLEGCHRRSSRGGVIYFGDKAASVKSSSSKFSKGPSRRNVGSRGHELNRFWHPFMSRRKSVQTFMWTGPDCLVRVEYCGRIQGEKLVQCPQFELKGQSRQYT